MAETKKSEPKIEEPERKTVVFSLPLLPDGKDTPQFVSVNGATYKVRRGINVEMPLEVYEVLRQREKAMIEAYRAQSALQMKA